MKIGEAAFYLILFALASQKNHFWQLENTKLFFNKKLGTCVGNIVSDGNMPSIRNIWPHYHDRCHGYGIKKIFADSQTGALSKAN